MHISPSIASPNVSRQSAEGRKRADHLYNLVLVLGFNDRLRSKAAAARSSCISRIPG
jgi:hypothetical protein